MKRNYLSRYRNEALSRISDGAGADQYNNLVGNGAMELSPNNRTITLTIVNAATTDKTVVLFDCSDPTDAAKDANITITAGQGSTHVKMKWAILSGRSFMIMGMKMTATAAAQFANDLSVVRKVQLGGKSVTEYYTPNNDVSAQNNITTQVDAPAFKMLVDSESYISYTQKGSYTVTFTFTVKDILAPSNALNNLPTREVSNVAWNSGLPQITMADPNYQASVNQF